MANKLIHLNNLLQFLSLIQLDSTNFSFLFQYLLENTKKYMFDKFCNYFTLYNNNIFSYVQWTYPTEHVHEPEKLKKDHRQLKKLQYAVYSLSLFEYNMEHVVKFLIDFYW